MATKLDKLVFEDIFLGNFQLREFLFANSIDSRCTYVLFLVISFLNFLRLFKGKRISVYYIYFFSLKNLNGMLRIFIFLLILKSVFSYHYFLTIIFWSVLSNKKCLSIEDSDNINNICEKKKIRISRMNFSRFVQFFGLFFYGNVVNSKNLIYFGFFSKCFLPSPPKKDSLWMQ